MFLGLEIGSWAEWVGAFGTILTVWLSIRFYSKDNRMKFLVRQTHHIVSKEENGSTALREGVTLSGFNDSAQTALFAFNGFYLQPRRWLRVRLWFLNGLISFQWTNRWLYELVELREKARPLGDINVKSVFFGNDFETVEGHNRTKDVKIPFEYLLSNIVNMLRQDKYNLKRLKKGKKVIIVYVFQKHDGTEYHSRMVIGTETVKKIKEKLNGNKS